MQTETKKAGTFEKYIEGSAMCDLERNVAKKAWDAALASVAGAENAGEFVPTNHEPLPGVTLWSSSDSYAERGDGGAYIKVDFEPAGNLYPSGEVEGMDWPIASVFDFGKLVPAKTAKSPIDMDALATLAARVRAERAARQAGAEKVKPVHEWSRIVTPKGRTVKLWNSSTQSSACWMTNKQNTTAFIDSEGKCKFRQFIPSDLLPNQWPLPPGTAERIDAFLDAQQSAPEPAKPKPWDSECVGELFGKMLLRDKDDRAEIFRPVYLMRGGVGIVYGFSNDTAAGAFYSWKELANEWEYSIDGGMKWKRCYGPYQTVVADGGKGGDAQCQTQSLNR